MDKLDRVTDGELIAELKAGNETAFMRLVKAHHPAMDRVAKSFVGSEAVAEEVTQEAWLAVLGAVDAFEGRSSLRTWIFKILCNCAKKRRLREGRSVPMSSLVDDEDAPSVPADRFQRGSDALFEGNWSRAPEPWADALLASAQAVALAKRAIEDLPEVQRAVITLRDVEGMSSDEVCEALELTEGNQRVQLHRARSKVRAALERDLAKGAEGT